MNSLIPTIYKQTKTPIRAATSTNDKPVYVLFLAMIYQYLDIAASCCFLCKHYNAT